MIDANSWSFLFRRTGQYYRSGTYRVGPPPFPSLVTATFAINVEKIPTLFIERLLTYVYSTCSLQWLNTDKQRLKMFLNSGPQKIQSWPNGCSLANVDPELIQNSCITFIQRRPNVFDVGPTLYKCYTKCFAYWASITCMSPVPHRICFKRVISKVEGVLFSRGVVRYAAVMITRLAVW